MSVFVRTFVNLRISTYVTMSETKFPFQDIEGIIVSLFFKERVDKSIKMEQTWTDKLSLSVHVCTFVNVQTWTDM